MTDGRLLERVARWLAARSGSNERAAELRDHLDEAAERGHRTSIGDVGSLMALSLRATLRRAVSDLPWWIAGLPVAAFMVLLLATTYETHFAAWDFVSNDEVVWTTQARTWKTIIDVALVVSLVAALFAGRRTIEQLRHGRLLLPGALLVAMFASVTQVDLFIERTPWWRDGTVQGSLSGLRPEHVNEIAPYSIGLFAAFALIPFGFLVLDRLRRPSRTEKAARSAKAAPTPAGVDPAALSAVFLPLTFPVIGVVALVGWWIAVLAAPSFSRRLKAVASALILVTTATATVWTVFIAGPADEPSGLSILVVLGSFALVWIWIGLVALRPITSSRFAPPKPPSAPSPALPAGS